MPISLQSFPWGGGEGNGLSCKGNPLEGICGRLVQRIKGWGWDRSHHPEGIKLEHSFRLGFKASNNEAEYEALLVGLRVVSDLGAKEVEVYSDSRLVVNQVQGSFEAKDPRMMEYLRLVKQTIDRFLSIRVVQVARGQNQHTDSLATLASSSIEEIP